jgi:hypothetical protein
MEQRIITFNEEQHSYIDEYDVSYISVTQLIHKFEDDFQTRFWAAYRAVDQMEEYQARPFPELNSIELRIGKKRQKYNIELIYSGMIPVLKHPDTIIKEWKEITEEACEWGNYRHGYLEDCANRFARTTTVNPFDTYRQTDDYLLRVTSYEELQDSPLRETFPSIYRRLEYAVLNGWTIYAEKRVYSVKYRIAGTIDCLLVKGDKFHILDWKTNKFKLQFEAGYYKKAWDEFRTKKIVTDNFIKTTDTLKAPLDNLYSSKGTLYTLQLSLYSVLCEEWGYSFGGLTLCHIRPQLDPYGQPITAEGQRVELEPEFYKLDYLKEDVNKLLHWRLNNLTVTA